MFVLNNIEFSSLNDMLNYSNKTEKGQCDIFKLFWDIDTSEGKYFHKHKYVKLDNSLSSERVISNFFNMNNIPSKNTVMGVIEKDNRGYKKLSPNDILDLKENIENL